MKKSGFKKMVATFLLLCMLISMTAGCSKSGEQSSGQGSKEDGKSMSSKDSSTNSKAGTESDAKKIKIELVTGDSVVLPPEDDNFINQALNEALDLDLTLTIMGAGDDYSTALNTRISGGEVPDMFAVPNKQSFQQYADSGLLMSLTPYLDKIKPVVEWVGGEDHLNPNIYKGEMYRVPKKGQRPYSIWNIRKDWMDAVDAEIPKTPEDVLEVAKKFAFEDPDGNGKDDTFGFSASGFGGLDAIVNTYGGSLGNHVIIRDNEVNSSILQPKMKDALKMCKEFIDAGVVDPDLTANNSDTLRDKLVQGKVGMTFYECSGLYKKMFMDQVLAVNPNAKWIWFDNIQGPESADNETLDVSDVAGRWVISKEVEEDKEKRDRILDLLNYVVSKEGLNLVSYGIEGRHYNIENEKIVPTEQMSKECDFLWAYQICFRDDLPYCQTKFPEAKDAFASAHEADRYEIYDEAVDIPDGLHKSDMDKYITDNMIKFVYGERPVDEYDNFIQELKDSFQFDEYMEAAKSQMKEKGYIK